MRKTLLWFACCAAVAEGQTLAVGFQGPVGVYAPDVVSTAATEVRLAVSPDGRHEVWGAIGRSGGAGGFDLFERERKDGAWQVPRAVSFNSAENDFDPAFALDGKGLYFFSNRPGGQGGDDLWFVPLQKAGWGRPINLGAVLNSSDNEWAPTPLAHDCLLFSSDGHGGAGKQDLLRSCRKGGAWSKPTPLDGVNSAEFDYDAAVLSDDHSLVFTRSANPDEGARLYLALWSGKDYSVTPLPEAVNSPAGWNFGPSVSAARPGVLFYSSHWPENQRGRIDIYELRYSFSGSRAR